MDHDDYDFTTYRIHRIQNGIMDMADLMEVMMKPWIYIDRRRHN